VTDTLVLIWGDGTKARIEAPAGTGEAVLEQIVSRKGEYASGWIVSANNPHKRLNLAAVISVEVQRESDRGSRGRSAPR
jgi:hypothetical protein